MPKPATPIRTIKIRKQMPFHNFSVERFETFKSVLDEPEKLSDLFDYCAVCTEDSEFAANESLPREKTNLP